MKNFDEILAEVARQNGTTPENVLHEMQLAGISALLDR